MALSETQQDDVSPKAETPSATYGILQWIVLKVVVPTVILLVLWHLIASLTRISLIDVVNALLRLKLEGDSEGIYLIQHVSSSVNRVTLGFLAAAVTGIPLGIIIGGLYIPAHF